MNCERSRKREILKHIGIRRIARMGAAEANASLKGYMRKTLAELREILAAEAMPKPPAELAAVTFTAVEFKNAFDCLAYPAYHLTRYRRPIHYRGRFLAVTDETVDMLRQRRQDFAHIGQATRADGRKVTVTVPNL